MALAHYDTFRVQLASTHPAFGHALWEPDPGEDFPPVEIGDVGFIRQGNFHRLFNALLPENHPSHDTFGAPENHELLQPSTSNHINRGTLHPNNFCSYGIKVSSGESNFNASEPPAAGSAEVSISCSRKEGAVLSLPVAARRQDTFAQAHFRTWIITHIDSWFNFTQRHGLGVAMEDIVLVTGCHRTRSWSNIAFYEGQAGARVSFGVQVPGIHGTTVHWRVSSQQVQGAVLSHGPSGENLPDSQCIFIRGFRVKRTFKLFPRVRGAAEPIPDPSEKDDEQETEAVSIASVPEYRDPLLVLLDYLAEREPNCDLALVHDDDLERILRVGNGSSLEALQPAEVMNHLRSSKLEIGVAVMPDPLPPNDASSSSRTDTNDMNVAMLSEQLKDFAYPPKATPSSPALASTATIATAMTSTGTSSSPKILHRPPRPSGITPTSIRTSLSTVKGFDLPISRDILQSPEVDATQDAFEMAINSLKETSSLIKNVPYLEVIAGVFLELARTDVEVDLYRESWEEVMYNIIKVADLVKHFGVACQRHGLCDEATFPPNFVGTIKALRTELVQMVGVMSQCRGKTRFELFKKGLARSDMIKEIQKCDRQMNRMFDRFLAAMVMDVRFQQLVSERLQPTPTPTHMLTPISSVTIEGPQPSIFTKPEIRKPVEKSQKHMLMPTPPFTTTEKPKPTLPSVSFFRDQINQLGAQTPSLHARSMTKESNLVRPIRPQVFFGRDDELKTIIELIFSSAVAARIAILGPSGVGKTTLANAVLTHEKVVSQFGDSRYFVPCEELHSRVALLLALANSLPNPQNGMSVDGRSVGLEQRVLSALGSEKCILCLDGFESPWDEPGPRKKAVERLLADITALSSVTVLITMRGEERPNETVWTLPMLPPLTNFSLDAAKRTWRSIAGDYDERAEQFIGTVDYLPVAVTQLGSLTQATPTKCLWEQWNENIAQMEKMRGDKVAMLALPMILSLESGQVATAVSLKRLSGILSMLGGMPRYDSPRHVNKFPYVDAVWGLLKRGADVNTTENLRTPLHLATTMGYMKLAQMLLEHGAGVDRRDDDGQPLLHPVSNRTTTLERLYTRILVEFSAGVKARNRTNTSPLSFASYYGHSQIAKLLLNHGVDAQTENTLVENHATPIHLASSLEIVRLLLDCGVTANMVNVHGRTPLHLISQDEYFSDERPDIARLSLELGLGVNAQDKFPDTPLHFACTHGNLEIARALLDHGADVNAQNKGGQTPLHSASRFSQQFSSDYKDDPSVFISQLLLDRGAEVDARDKFHATPLHWASYDSKLETVQMLLDHGAEADAKNTDGRTPLHLASQSSGHREGDDSRAVVRLLLEHGADANARDKALETPLHLASYKLDLKIVQILLDYGAEADARNADGQTPLHRISQALQNDKSDGPDIARLLITHGADVNARDKDRETPLHLASYYGYSKVGEMLLDHGAQARVENVGGQSPLHQVLLGNQNYKSFSMNSYTQSDPGKAVCFAQRLLELGADVNAQNKDHDTPLHLASQLQLLEVSQLLLKHGANVDLKNSNGKSAFQLASERKGEAMRQLFLEYSTKGV